MESHSRLSQRNYAFRKELRRNNLKQFFALRRSQLKQEGRQKDIRDFNETYPKITEDNFGNPEIIDFVVRFSHNPDFNYMLLPMGPHLSEYIIRNPQSQGAFYALEGLSEYGELQVAWTQELCRALIKQMNRNVGGIMRTVANLLQSGSGGSQLRNELLEAGWVQVSQNALLRCKQETTVEVYQNTAYFYLWSCSLMLQTHPTLPAEWFKQLVETINKGSSVSGWKDIVVGLLEEIAHSCKPVQFVARILQVYFGELCLCDFNSFQQQLTVFLGYYFTAVFGDQEPEPTPFISRALQLLISNLFLPLPAGSQHEHPKALPFVTFHILHHFLSYWQASVYARPFYNSLTQHDCVSALCNLFPHLQYKNQLKCLEVLTKLSPYLIAEIEDRGEDKELRQEYVGCLQLVVEGLGSHGPQMTVETVKLVIALAQSLYQRGLYGDKSCWGSLMERSGVVKAVEDVSGRAQGEFRSVLDNLETVLSVLIREQL